LSRNYRWVRANRIRGDCNLMHKYVTDSELIVSKLSTRDTQIASMSHTGYEIQNEF
jgi:hypothetical protein